MTEFQQTEIVRLWGEGVPEAEIAKRVGLKMSSVHTYVDMHRDECPRRQPRHRTVKRPGYGDIAALADIGCWEVEE